jgi:hypothetical protein
MKRHEVWRAAYRQTRDLDHLTSEELSERLHDCFNNIRTRSLKGKISFRSSSDRVGETWWSLLTEILEECSLRGFPHPGPIDISKFRSALDHASDPIPDMDRIFERYDLTHRPYILKFGDFRWMSESIEHGRFRIASASYYDSEQHNHARRDTELERYLHPNPRNANFVGPAVVSGWSSIRAHTDYYLFSLSETYSARLFGDFAANSCLVIFDKKKFLSRLQRTVTKQLPGWQIQVSRVNYYDPVRMDPSKMLVSTSKPFKHAHQEELRLICTPPHPTLKLEPFLIELGSLKDCAMLADLAAFPPAKLPHDPYDDPVQTFGNYKTETAMLNRLPSAAKIDGISLQKGAPRHEDWTIQLQYTDSVGNRHELEMPMLEGLYLLNLLRTAEEDQHLGFLNRPKHGTI